MADMEKEAQKGVKDPAQQALRQKKKEWSKNVASPLISQIIAFKRGLNGKGDLQAGVPPSNIKDPLPPEVSQYLEEMTQRYQEMAAEAHKIIEEQAQYSQNRRKSQQEIPATASLEQELGKIALGYKDRSTAFSRMITWVMQYPWFRSDEITKSRIDMMYALADFENQINDIEYLLTSLSANSESRSFYEFSRFLSLFERMFIRKFNSTLDQQVAFFKENAEKIGKPTPPSGEAEREALKMQMARDREDSVVVNPPTRPNNTKEEISKITVDLDRFSELKTHLDQLKGPDTMGMVQIHENLRRKINEINNSNIEDTTDIYKLYNELLNSISIAFGQPGIKSIEEMADILRKKQAETLLFLVKTAEKKTFRRWVQRTMLAMRTGEYARAKSDSAKNLRNIGMEMDLVQELFQNKNVLLSEAAPHISSIYIGLADACDFFAFMAETHNYEYGQQRSVGGKHPTIGPIDMSKVNYLKKFGKLLTNEAEKMAEIKPEVPGQEKIAQASEEVRLVLSPKAQAVVDLIREVIKAKAPSTTVRIAGGFVRDALLGKESHDIDLAVDNMSGEAFANLVKEYLSEHGERIGEVTIVKANPDQSKNLETAMLKVLGLPIDFVALRNEIYTDNSRIPQVSTSTAEEDAERRDLTINSIFYNINTGKVEDFVGGIQDLKNGIARTPRDPIKTFLDDPLRILRTVRFAAKYNLKLDPDLIKAANTPEVREAFKKKISQERIWMELAGQAEDEGWKAGALMGPNPTQAARLLAQLGLRDIIFDLGDQEKTELGLEGELVPWETNQNNPHHDLNIWEHSLSTLSNLVDQTKEDIKEDKEAYLVRNIAAILHDIGKRYKGIQGIHEKGHTTYHGHEEMSAKMAEKILERLHAPTSIIKKVIKLIGTHLRPHVLSESYTPKSGRKYVTDMGDLWGHGIDLAIADTQGKGTKPGIEQYEVLRRNIEESMPKGESGQMLTSVPLPVTGNDLIEIGIKPGPVMGSILTVLRDRILSNPNLTKEEALSIAKELHDRR